MKSIASSPWSDNLRVNWRASLDAKRCLRVHCFNVSLLLLVRVQTCVESWMLQEAVETCLHNRVLCVPMRGGQSVVIRDPQHQFCSPSPAILPSPDLKNRKRKADAQNNHLG